MDKQELINIFQKVKSSHNHLLRDGQVLLDGINLDQLEEPLKCEDCEFSLWCSTHENEISGFSWFDALKESHINVHNKFGVLFHESMRKYNPKTFDQLLERFEGLNTEVESFSSKLQSIESELDALNDDEFKQLLVNESVSVDVGMHEVEIDQYQESSIEIEINDEFENEHTKSEIDSCEESSDLNDKSLQTNKKDTKLETTNDEIGDEKEITHKDEPETVLESNLETMQNRNSSETADRHISLKEQYITQLEQQKELSELELVHLEQTQKLTTQSVKQLEQSYTLKKQEVELDLKDNERLIAFKSNTRKEVLNSLNKITANKQSLRKLIQDLEKENLEEQLKQDSQNNNSPITKQFEELKHNKNIDLEKLQQHLNVRKVDLKQLHKQVLLIEEDISDMEMQISKKQQDMVDLEEKEQIKNQQLAIQLEDYEENELKRHSNINEKQIALNTLLDQDVEKQRELELIDFQVRELQKNSEFLENTNNGDLTEIKDQQEIKREKLVELVNLKSFKETEISKIDKKIDQEKKILSSLKSPNDDEKANKDNDIELSIAE